MEDAAARRARIAAEMTGRTGIDEAMISVLVTTFYAQVRNDPLIGPIFEEKICPSSDDLRQVAA